MPAVGLDVGSSSIKLVELSGNKKKPKLSGYGLALNPVGNIETENQTERVKIAEAIKKLFSDAGVSERSLTVSLPESKVFTRVVDIPVLSDAELASAISWEAEQYVPIPISEVQLDYRVLSRPENTAAGAKMQVLLVAAPTTIVGKLVNLLTMAGLQPEVVETEVLGFSRALVRGPSTSTVMIVHLGAESTDICIMEGEIIVFTRALPTGGNAFSRALANELGLDQTQAEQYKRSYGLDGNQLQGKVRAALQSVFGSIVSEMRKAVHFYTANKKGKITRMILSGGGAYLPELTADLAKIIGVEVVVGNPFEGVAMEASQQQRVGGVAAVFSVATGLALRNM